jgi:hypothetical protein
VRTTLAVLVAVALLVLAGLAALLAADARGWQRTIRSDDALVASTPAAATWQPPTRLGSLSERLLGLRDDLQLRRAIALYLRTIRIPVRLDNAQSLATARGRAEQALAAVARNGSGRRASQAATLLGVLVFTDVGPSADPFHPTTGTDLDQAQASLTDFEDAVRADPEDAVAKYDLELVLRILVAQGVRVGAGQQTGAGSTGQRGAGGGVAGGGY